MTTPVIVLTFGPNGQPFSLDGMNDNNAAIVAAINALAAEPLLQLGVTPGNLSGYLPITGGSLLGQITAPSVLVGPVGGPQFAALTVNDAATEGANGVVKKAAANTDAVASTVAVAAVNATTSPAGGTGAAAGGWDTAVNRDLAITAVNQTSALANELKTDLATLVTNFNSLVTQFNAVQAKMRTAGQLTP